MVLIVKTRLRLIKVLVHLWGEVLEFTYEHAKSKIHRVYSHVWPTKNPFGVVYQPTSC